MINQADMEKLLAETRGLCLETLKLQAERLKLDAESAKLPAQTQMAQTQAAETWKYERWLPAVVIGGIVFAVLLSFATWIIVVLIALARCGGASGIS